MSEHIRFNKVFLREQKQKMAMYQRFLPALEARKQQLLLELAIIRKNIQEQREILGRITTEINTWSKLYNDMGQVLRFFISIQETRTVPRNIAGLKIMEFRGVVFDDPGYSFFNTPYSFDMVLKMTRESISVMEHIRILENQEHLLLEGFRKTSQRINLYEKRLIPHSRDAIRKISVYLQDQQAAAVGVAKVAKRLTQEATYYGH